MLNTNKIKLCRHFLEDPAPEIVSELVSEIELLRGYVDHLAACNACTKDLSECPAGREIMAYFEKTNDKFEKPGKKQQELSDA